MPDSPARYWSVRLATEKGTRAAQTFSVYAADRRDAISRARGQWGAGWAYTYVAWAF